MRLSVAVGSLVLALFACAWLLNVAYDIAIGWMVDEANGACMPRPSQHAHADLH